MRLGQKYFDTRNRQRHGTFCGFTGYKHAKAMLKHNGKVFTVGRRYLKRLDCSGCSGVW